MTASDPAEPLDDGRSAGPPDPPAPPPADPVAETPSGPDPLRGQDPLRGSRTSGFWVAVVGLLAVIVLLAVFVLQNTQAVEITFLAWTGTAPLAAALLIAAAAGLALATLAGSLRILQLRRRVKRTHRG